jgi:hypothetical protein
MDNDAEYVVMYGSRSLKDAEIHFGILEKECLAVFWAVKRCRVYIYGMSTTTIVTYHSALIWLLCIPEPTDRLARWALYLSNYQIDIVYRKGNLQPNVDVLSRPVFLVPPQLDAPKQLNRIQQKNSSMFMKMKL